MTKKRKRRGPYDPYPGWGDPRSISDEEFYRIIGNGPVAFTRPGPPPAATAPPAEQKPPAAAPLLFRARKGPEKP
jgi:hypothetical protein